MNIKDILCLNIAEGGIGGANFKGKHHTKESMIKMIETRKKNGHLKHSESTKRKISDALKGKKSNRRNYKHSDETKLKIKLKALEREKIKREQKMK